MNQKSAERFSLLLSNGELVHNLCPFFPFIAPKGLTISAVKFADEFGIVSDNLFGKKDFSFDGKFRFFVNEGCWTKFYSCFNPELSNVQIIGFQYFCLQDIGYDPEFSCDSLLELLNFDSSNRPCASPERIRDILNVYIKIVNDFKIDNWLLIIHSVRFACELMPNDIEIYERLLDSLNSNLIDFRNKMQKL